MASKKKVILTVEVELVQVSPKDTISDDDIQKNIKDGMQDLFNWGDTQNAGLYLREYNCEVVTLESSGVQDS